jgi:hypothetical protein
LMSDAGQTDPVPAASGARPAPRDWRDEAQYATAIPMYADAYWDADRHNRRSPLRNRLPSAVTSAPSDRESESVSAGRPDRHWDPGFYGRGYPREFWGFPGHPGPYSRFPYFSGENRDGVPGRAGPDGELATGPEAYRPFPDSEEFYRNSFHRSDPGRIPQDRGRIPDPKIGESRNFEKNPEFCQDGPGPGSFRRSDPGRIPVHGSQDRGRIPDPKIGGSRNFEKNPEFRQDGPGPGSGPGTSTMNTSGSGSGPGSSCLPDAAASGRPSDFSRRSPEINDETADVSPDEARSRRGDRSGGNRKSRHDRDRSPEAHRQHRTRDTSRSRRRSRSSSSEFSRSPRRRGHRRSRSRRSSSYGDRRSRSRSDRRSRSRDRRSRSTSYDDDVEEDSKSRREYVSYRDILRSCRNFMGDEIEPIVPTPKPLQIISKFRDAPVVKPAEDRIAVSDSIKTSIRASQLEFFGYCGDTIESQPSLPFSCPDKKAGKLPPFKAKYYKTEECLSIKPKTTDSDVQSLWKEKSKESSKTILVDRKMLDNVMVAAEKSLLSLNYVDFFR